MQLFHTKLCDLLGIKYPIILGGMVWAGEAGLVAAVSNAGGLGLIGSGNIPEENLKEEIKKVKALTNKPFGVNIVPLAGVSMDERIRTIAEAEVPIVAAAFSDPTAPIIAELHQYNVKVLAVVPSVKLAMRVEEEGADVIVASGTEAGGHCSYVATMPLVPQVVDAVNTPVVACGGIGDSRGFLAALALGACGIQMGTRFLATQECITHHFYKNAILQAADEDTVITGKLTGTTCRVLKNSLAEEWLRKEKNKKITKKELQTLGVGKIKSALIDGDIEYGSVVCGQVAGMIKKIKRVDEVIDEIISGAEKIYKSISPYAGSSF